MAECVLYLCKVLLFLVLCVYHLDLTVADDIITYLKPAADFSKHTLVKPKIYHGREKRQISTSREKGSTGDTHVHDLTVTLGLNGVEHVLDLRLNRDLLPKGYFRRYQKNGRHVVDRPETENIELCQYQGVLRGVPSSWAALSTCRKGLSGIIYDGKELHYIERASENDNKGLDTEHFLYKHSDLIETNKTCGYDGDGDHHHHHPDHEFNRILRYKRASEPQIRGPYNANKRSRYVELVLVIDNKEYKDMGENLSKVYQHCKEIANIINGLYSSLNIFIALVGVVVWTEHDEIDLSPSGDKTLTNFLHYRREMLIKEHPNDNAQLLTKFVFDKGVVGKALKGPICTFEYSGGVSMDHSTVVSLVATTVAHEMGHNFGMEHDSNDCQCPEERCIMAPSSSSLWPTHWSSCSLEYLALAFEHGMDYCLRNKPQSLFDSPVCGNGFVEPGEQCDCGLPHTCDNTCCNATTCMLYSNASCATGECCDLKTCRPKVAGSLCRAADYECDLPEYCTGQSEYCPANIYKMDTESCDSGKAFCYQGSCRTRSDQCKLLWGNTGKSSDDQCYNMNTKGSRHGNCGYHRVNQSYIKCEDENVLCGMLHCRHLNERLEFGMESVAILSQSFINLKGSIIPCRTAIVDLGINQVDPGLAPDGARCGEGKMCVNQKCMAVASLRANINKCPQDCNGNGVCNSLGHCHCKTGFAPPYCDYPGPGGSEDSGPATDPNARKEFVMAMYIVFLGIIPIIAIVAFLMYYTKHNVNFKWQKTSVASKSPGKPRGGNAFPPEPTVRNDDNSSLLQDHQTNSSFQNEFFGQFKGFKLSPMGGGKTESPEQQPQQTTKPIRSAPPVPAVPVPTVPSIVVKTPTHVSRSNTTHHQNHTSSLSRPLMRTNSEKQPSIANALINANSASVAPALPPPNPGSNPRPLISSPILENSTCTAKELMSPLRTAPKVPTRPAPEVTEVVATITTENKRPLSSPNTIINAVVLMPEDHIVKKPKEGGGTLNRIASFLKSKEDKSKATNNIKANKIMDKNALRTMEISGPIPQNEIEIAVNSLPVDEDPKDKDKEKKTAVVMRAQSMRGTNVTTRPNIPNFGSMRQPNFKRPTSIPVGNRPKSPPPPRPPLPEINDNINKIPGLPGYQTPTCKSDASGADKKKSEYHYDDCMNEAPLAKISEELSPNSGDNIYAVIEESPKSLETVKSNSGSSESVGLLGEIVSEIQNRNFDSIYSTSTLARKQKEKLLREQNKQKAKAKNSPEDVGSPETNNDTYVNTSSIYKSPESVYSNMGNLKSSASSTASGYIHPSAVNAPVVKPPVSVSVTVAVTTSSIDAKSTNVAPKTTMSTFKSDPKPDLNTYKPFASTLQRSSGPLASSFKSKQKPTENDTNKTNGSTSPTTKTTTKPLTRQTTPPNLNKQISPPISRQTTPTNLTKRSPSPTITRQTTPPNLRTRKPSPTRTVPSSPKNLPKAAVVKSNSNSPDLVISCSNTTPANTKSPDVLNSSSANKINAKPNSLPKPQNVTPKAAPTKITIKPVNVKSPTDKKPFINKSNSDVKPPIINAKIVINKANSDVGSNNIGKSVPINARIAAKQTSNVASLQQKFENNKPPIATKNNVAIAVNVNHKKK